MRWSTSSLRITFRYYCIFMHSCIFPGILKWHTDHQQAMHILAPAYSSELCASSCVEGQTRSSARGKLVVQRTRTKFGRHAFVVAGPVAWNRLPRTVSRRLWRHFCSLSIFNCTVHLPSLCCCICTVWSVVYSSLGPVIKLRHPRNYHDIIIIITNK